jgi:eukaryotic-like serine/threonine-protein kinase
VTNPTKIGRYEIIERVGRGGMGVLYRGRDTVLEREVAIKVMSTDFDADADDTARPRFYREARAAAKLQHRNIVTVFEFGEEEHTPFIVMEFLRGQDLSRRMRSDPPLTLEEKLDIIADLCTGLHFAHEQGVVHRDVKPANIWIQTDKSIKLLDFGIAKFSSSTMTRQGSVFGSVSYMSPEQVSGGEVDGRADIFSAGVVLYELLTGKKPFEGDSPTAVLARIMDERPASLEALGPDVPRPLAAAVAKALQKDRDRRYRHAADFGADLRLVRSALSASEPLTMQVELTRGIGPDLGTTLVSDAPPADPAGAVKLVDVPTPPGALAPARPTKWMVPAIAGGVLVVAVLSVLVLRGSGGPAAAPGTAQPAAAAQPQTPGQAGSPAPIVPDKRKAPAVERSRTAAAPKGASAQVAPAGAAGLTRPQPTTVDPPAPAPPAAGSEVVVTGSYAFEIYADGRLLSGASSEHRVRVAGRQAIQLKAPEYFLDTTLTVDSGTKHALAPELGRLLLYIPEVCTATIGGRNLGEPPYPEMPIAAGNYRVQLACPDGSARNMPITIRPGELRRERLNK